MVWKEVLNKTKEVGEKVAEKGKEVGERVIGRGAEVDFRHEVNDAVNRRIPKSRAEKESFLDRVEQVGDEIRHTGCVDSKSKSWRGFEAGLNELFDNETKEQFLEDANDVRIFRNIILAPTSRSEYNAVKAYFKGKFDGETPSSPIIGDMATNIKFLAELNARIFGDLSPFAGNNVDIRDLLTTHPEIGADFGMAQQIKEQIEQAEIRFGREVLSKREWEKYKEDAGGSLREIFWGAPTEFLSKTSKVFGNILKNPSQKNVLGGFIPFSTAILKFAGKELLETSKLAYGGTKATLLYINKLRK